MSLPWPGKQSAVDQMRVPSAPKTVNTCNGPDRSRTQGWAERLVTVIVSRGCTPGPKEGADVDALTTVSASAQSSRPCGSWEGGGGPGVGLAGGFAVGAAVSVGAAGAGEPDAAVASTEADGLGDASTGDGLGEDPTGDGLGDASTEGLGDGDGDGRAEGTDGSSETLEAASSPVSVGTAEPEPAAAVSAC